MLKLAYFLKNIKTSRVNNSRILKIKNAKFSCYYFYMNTGIQRDFQICISVPLKELRKYKIKIFLCPTQKICEHSHHLYILSQLTFIHFVIKYTFCLIKPTMWIQKNKFVSNEQYLFSRLFSRVAKNSKTVETVPKVQQRMQQIFSSFLKKKKSH